MTGAPPTSGEFNPISFQTTQDPLGTSLTSSKSSDDYSEGEDKKRPSLTKIVLSLTTPAKQQESLSHIQTALQVCVCIATEPLQLIEVLCSRLKYLLVSLPPTLSLPPSLPP